jgi:hypothetical protein
MLFVMNFEGTKLGICDTASVTEFLKRITTFSHFALIASKLSICIIEYCSVPCYEDGF